MSWKQLKKKSINEIFNAMDICDELNTCKLEHSGDCLKSDESVDDSYTENLNKISDILKGTAESKSIESAIDAANKAVVEWSTSDSLRRAEALHTIWKFLRVISKALPNLENELLTLMNYFDFYADVVVTDTELQLQKPNGVILVVLTNCCPFFALGATVAPALAAGCSVIVLVPENVKGITLLLKEVAVAKGLPAGVLNTVTESIETALPFFDRVGKVIFCGSYTSAAKWYSRCGIVPFNFFCPGNTTAFILESADLDAAADRIVRERCLRNSVFAISNIIIQESVSKIFLEKFRFRMQQFMNTNKKSKVKDFRITEKVRKTSEDALKSGGFVEKYEDFENEIGQTIAINYQNQDVDEDGTVLKVLLCRTAKEGVALLNNCRYNLGTSIWSEISSQALEVSSMLTCPNIWINSHGVFEAGEPLQLLGFSGNCVLGGMDGLLEHSSFNLYRKHVLCHPSETKTDSTEKVNILKMASTAQSAFNTWKNERNRREYLTDIADSLKKSEEFSVVSKMIRGFGHFGNLTTTSSQRNPQGRLIIKRKIPVGVFLLIVNEIRLNMYSLGGLITTLISFGNAVIVTLMEANSTFNSFIKNFTNVLPKNVIQVIVGIENCICLASHPNIQDIWIYGEPCVPEEFLQTIKGCSATGLKNFWVIPERLIASEFLRDARIIWSKKCLRNQLIWLTNADQFP